MEEILLKYGLPGIVIGGLAYFVMYLVKDHRKERGEWKETMEKHIERQDKKDDETNKVLRDNTNILSGLKTLLENKK